MSRGEEEEVGSELELTLFFFRFVGSKLATMFSDVSQLGKNPEDVS